VRQSLSAGEQEEKIAMPMRDWQPLTWDSHPEFGLLCPSPARRRRLRFATRCALAGLAIAGMVELAAAHWFAPAPSAGVGSMGEVSLAQSQSAPTAAGIASNAAPMSIAAPATDEFSRDRPTSCQSDLKDPASAFLNPACSRQARVRHPGRHHEVATWIIGRTDAPPASSPTEAAPVPAAEPPQSASPAPPKASNNQTAGRAAAPPAKKTSPNGPTELPSPTRAPAQQFDPFAAFAAALRGPGSALSYR
jgi:hypothetical protein